MRNVAYRVGLVLLLFSMTASACKTTRGRVDEKPTVDVGQRAEKLPFDDDVVAVAKFHPKKLDRLAARSRADFRRIFEEASEQSEVATNLASRLVAVLFDSPNDLERITREPGVDFRFEGLDRSRTVYFALSERRNDDLLEDLYLAIPNQKAYESFAGQVARLAIPAKNPKELISEIEAHCREDNDGWMGSACQAIIHTRASGSHVVVELLYDASSDQREAYGKEVGDEEPEGGYFDRMTPAIRAFLGRDVAVGAYVKTGDLWKVGVLRLLVTHQEKEQPKKKSLKARMKGRRAQQREQNLVEQASFLSPGATEYEDVAILHEFDGEYYTDVVQTYTMKGRQIAEAGRIDAKLPTIGIEQPIIDVEWAYDTPSALRQVSVPPQVRSRSIYRRHTRLSRILKRFDDVVRLSPYLAYPVSWGKTLSGLHFGYRPTRLDALGRLKGLRAMRMKCNVSPSDETPLGIEFSGAAALQIPRESNLDATVETAVAIAKGMGIPIRLQTDYEGEIVQMKVTVNAAMSVFGEPDSVGSETLASLDIATLMKNFQDDELIEGLGLKGPEELQGLRRADILLASNSTGRGLRFRLGPKKRKGFSIPTADMKLADPEPIPRCARETIQASLEIVGDRGRPGLNFGSFKHYVPDIVESAKSCPDDSNWRAEAHRVAAANLEILADMHSKLRDWDAATKRYRQACEFGAESSCQRAEETNQRIGRLRLPDVGGVFRFRKDLPDVVMELGRDGLIAADQTLASLEELDPAAETSKSVIAGIEKYGGPFWMRTHHGHNASVAVAVDSSINSGTFKTLAGQIFEAQMSEEELSERRYVSRRKKGKKTDSIVIFMGEPDTDARLHRRHGANYVAVTKWTPASKRSVKKPLGLEVSVSERGFDVRTKEGEVSPVKGCPEDGPTVCLEVDQKHLSDLLEAYRKATSSGDEKRIRETVTTISSAYSYYRLHQVLYDLHEEHSTRRHRVRRIRISAKNDVPFDVLAKTMSAVAKRKWRGTYDTSDALFGDLSRQRKMFDSIRLDFDN